MSFVKNTDMKKSITEFLAGGLFAFSMFAVASFAVYFAQSEGFFDFVRSIAYVSADISSYNSSKADYHASEEEGNSMMPEPETEQEQDLGYRENELIVSDMLQKLTSDTG